MVEESVYKVPLDEVEEFLKGHDDEKYITNIEFDRKTDTIYKIINHPENGKKIVKDGYIPFCWMKSPSRDFVFYDNDRDKLLKGMKKYKINIKKLINGEKDLEKFPGVGYHHRIANGFNYLISTNGTSKDLQDFLKEGGQKMWVWNDNLKKNTGNPGIISLSPVEQYLIQTNKRIFKGIDDYDLLHKAIFDLETTGLNPKTSRIFLIGLKDNRGFEKVMQVSDDKSEIKAIKDFFQAIYDLKPDIVGGYNSENFDWYFIFERCNQLGIDITEIAKTLRQGEKIYRQEKTLKLGNETEHYEQTNMWGMSIIDIIHSARRAQAIDSNMKKTNLKYVCKYNKVAKDNRVYVKGDKIFDIWNKNDTYFFNDTNGEYVKTKPRFIIKDWYTKELVEQTTKDVIFLFGDNDERTGRGGQAKVMRDYQNDRAIGIRTKKAPNNDESSFYTDDEYEENIKKIGEDLMKVYRKVMEGKTIVIPSDGIGTGLSDLPNRAPKTFQYLRKKLKNLIAFAKQYDETDGQYIIFRYLMDDLWETIEVDNIYNQTSFLLGKYVPTTYQRVSTMGTAGLWKLVMLAWSYQNNYTVPIPEPKRDFVGGLSRLLEIGYNEDLTKLDFSSLYPAIALVHDIFPDIDFSGVLKSLLKFFHSERFKAKDLASKYKKEGNNKLASFYKRKQLPLKIFINSMYGAFTAPHAFPWAEYDKGEQITCTGRQYLRLMVAYYMSKGFKPVVLDTDGCNFVKPDNIDEFRYVGKGLHERTEEGKEYTGFDAVIAEFNDLYMIREMGLDIDGEWVSTINVARKNYALLNYDGTVDLTGNTIKSKALPEYLEDFINQGVVLLLKNDGVGFVNLYNKTIEKIYRGEMPLLKVASKSKVKETVEEYLNRGTNKNGNPLPKKAHMELVIQHGLHVDTGDIIYYVNDGVSASHGDVTVKYVRDENDRLIKFAVDDKGNFIKDENGEYIVDKKGEKMEDGIYSYLLPEKDIEENPDKLGSYNVPRLIKAFNKRVEVFLICFKPDIRHNIIRELEANPEWKKDKTQPKFILSEQMLFTKKELELDSGNPEDEGDQDSIQELMTPDPREVEFWKKLDYDPRIWFKRPFRFDIPGFTKAYLQDS